MEVTPKDMQDLVLEAARYREERDAVTIDRDAHRDRSAAQEETIRLLRARLAEVERERDESRARFAALTWNGTLMDYDQMASALMMRTNGMAQMERERDDARRVAKRLALCGEYFHNDDLPAWMDAQKTALAYEVEP